MFVYHQNSISTFKIEKKGLNQSNAFVQSQTSNQSGREELSQWVDRCSGCTPYDRKDRKQLLVAGPVALTFNVPCFNKCSDRSMEV